jgi:AmmeMemoRadiSam system protein A
MYERRTSMNKLLTCYLVPHPPIMVPGIGRGEEKKIEKTIEAMEEIARTMSNEKPEIVVLITPHGPVFSDAIAVSLQDDFSGSFDKFGQPDVSLSFKGHADMSFRIMEEAAREGVPIVALDSATARKYGLSSHLDHGALVPLYYINKSYQGFKLVHITYGMLSNLELYRFGKSIQKVIENGTRRVSVVCSGDLSHRLTREAPAGYSKMGKEFDQKVVSYLGSMDVENMLCMDSSLVEEAGECGYRSILILLGALDGYEIKSSVLSYEGPFGVGYCVSTFKPVQKNPEREFIDRIGRNIKEEIERVRKKEDEYVRLAREALEAYVRNRKFIDIPGNLPAEMTERKAGVFVSIKKNGKLRGCIGTIHPTTGNIAEEIIHNAISAGTRDPRFYPVEENELKDLIYSVDVLTEPEPIDTVEQLDVKKYGVIVKSGRRSGLLLPDLEGIDTPEDQVRIALQKAGINITEPYTMERFEVIRHH